MNKDKRFIDRTRKRFGKLTVLEFDRTEATPCGKRRFFWVCKCDCGQIKSIGGVPLVNGDTTSCGCHRLSVLGASKLIHGQTNSKAFSSWRGMIERCSNPKHKQWIDYGGRGIEVCERWKTFINFLNDMGQPPVGFTIERNNSNGNYTFENCRWASRTEQARNKRNNRLIAFKGETKCMAEWAEVIGISYGALQSRLDRGWAIDRAMTHRS